MPVKMTQTPLVLSHSLNHSKMAEVQTVEVNAKPTPSSCDHKNWYADRASKDEEL
jgi:hypothetical protein